MNLLDPAALECLAALAEAGSFERAAQLLTITQSAVSQRLRALETQVGQLLVVRSRPLRMTEAGKVLLRYARQLQALRADAARELGATQMREERLPIAINADSLATWVLAALDALVHAGQREGYGLELIVDDQDFTHDRLREGEVLGCVSTVALALRGCTCQPLGHMRYIAAASPAFVELAMPTGLNEGNFAKLPFIVFNRKDDMQAQWVARAMGAQGALRPFQRGRRPRRGDGLGRGGDPRAAGAPAPRRRHAGGDPPRGDDRRRALLASMEAGHRAGRRPWRRRAGPRALGPDGADRPGADRRRALVAAAALTLFEGCRC
jgi:ArgP family transcriptional regulator